MKENFKSIQVLHLAMTGGCLMLGFIMVFLIGQEEKAVSLTMIFLMVSAMLTLSSVGGSFFLYKNKIKDARNIDGLDKKLENFRTSSIMRWAMIEASTLIAVVFMFVENNYYYLGFFIIGIIALLLTRPSIESFIKDYQLNNEEEMAIRNAMRE